MRAIWKGSIAFGLVHIPVNLYPATESQSISSNLLHKKCHSRIRYQRVSEATGKEVPAEEIVRGFEVERDNFVVISDDELKEAVPEKSATILCELFGVELCRLFGVFSEYGPTGRSHGRSPKARP